MGKAAKADISLLKRMITAKEISARPPYGATVEKIKQKKMEPNTLSSTWIVQSSQFRQVSERMLAHHLQHQHL
jgi:hypothetical protein